MLGEVLEVEELEVSPAVDPLLPLVPTLGEGGGRVVPGQGRHQLGGGRGAAGGRVSTVSSVVTVMMILPAGEQEIDTNAHDSTSTVHSERHPGVQEQVQLILKEVRDVSVPVLVSVQLQRHGHRRVRVKCV